jgi:hypothetical protein
MHPRAHAAPAQSSLVTNGSFEVNAGAGSSIFDGWTVEDDVRGLGKGLAGWFVQTGTQSPLNAFGVEAPTEGSFAAMTDQSGFGSHILYQDVTIPSGGADLRFDLFISSRDNFVTPDTLGPSPGSNQQFRMDVVDPSIPDRFHVEGVLKNVYRTEADAPPRTGYQTITASLDESAGRTVRLRFAEVDNRFFFSVGIDNVVVTPKGGRRPPVIDKLVALPRSVAEPRTGLPGDVLWCRLRDPDGDGPWKLTIDWGDGVVNTPSVSHQGDLSFVRRDTRLASGTYQITVTATDVAGLTSAPARVTIVVP